MKKALTLPLVALLAAVGLTGCQTPLQHAAQAAINLGAELDENMVHRNISGMIGFDEVDPVLYTDTVKNQLYLQGVEKGSPEYRMRVVRVNIRHPEWGGGVRVGGKAWYTTAIVPDYIGPLKASDLVELRSTGTTRVDQNFAATHEGNIVVRVLCRKSLPDFEACAATLPRTGEFIGFGDTNSYYPPTVAEYGFTFNQRYDGQGHLLK